MDYKQLKVILNSSKGEESVFALFRDGEFDKINEIAKLFMQAKVPAAQKFNEFINKASVSKKVVAGLYGEKGVGKSTLASVLALSSYLHRGLKEIMYFRYDHNSKTFSEIFKATQPFYLDQIPKDLDTRGVLRGFVEERVKKHFATKSAI